MKKEKLKAKAIVLSLVLAALLPATTVSAQGLLGGPSLVDEYWEEQDRSMLSRDGGSGGYVLNNGQFGSDEGGGYQLTNGTFGQDSVPLGGGIAILLGAGLGYAALKRKKED